MKEKVIFLEQYISYLTLFRGRCTGRKAQWLLAGVKGFLSQTISDQEKAQGIRQIFLAWQSWMQVIYPEEDALCKACLSLGEEIIGALSV